MCDEHTGNYCLNCDVINGYCNNDDIYKHVNNINRLPDSVIDYGKTQINAQILILF